MMILEPFHQTDRPAGLRAGISFWGLRMGQNENALPAFDRLFKVLEEMEDRPARIVELGTWHGGMSVLFHIYCKTVGAEFVTFDRNDPRPPGHKELHEALGIDWRQGDIRERVEEIGALIGQPGVTILVCDAGDKPWQVRTFAPFLKPLDVLLAHDYAPDRETFMREVRGHIWDHFELCDSDVAEVVKAQGLVRFLWGPFTAAAWACWRRLPGLFLEDEDRRGPFPSEELYG